MLPVDHLLLFALAALVMVLSPGPNMIYLISRAVCQGRRAGVISLSGVVAGFVLHMLAAAAGLAALFVAIPVAYELVKWLGAAYLFYLAWQFVRPGAPSPFAPRALPVEPAQKLFMMGFLTNALNPKIAVFYLSIFPQFVSPEHGALFVQGMVLGLVQIVVSFTVNLVIVVSAAKIAAWFDRNPLWLSVQRYLMGLALGGLAIRLAAEQRNA
ncbi:MAG: LysE family translocator [Gammaproteobacteria bacterium]|nr:LysE family translocator [Gammaproteobacteria bacterium]